MLSIARRNPAAQLSCGTLIRSLCVILLSVASAGNTRAQESLSPHTGAAPPLFQLLPEAEQNNPQIQAARQGLQAPKHIPSHVSTLPDPHFNLQQGHFRSPTPFA